MKNYLDNLIFIIIIQYMSFLVIKVAYCLLCLYPLVNTAMQFLLINLSLLCLLHILMIYNISIIIIINIDIIKTFIKKIIIFIIYIYIYFLIKN